MNDDEIGKVFGVVAVQGDISLIIGQIRSLCLHRNIWISAIVGSAIFNSMFTPLQRLTGLPGAAYLVGSSFLLLPLIGVISVFLMKKSRQEHHTHYHDNDAFQKE